MNNVHDIFDNNNEQYLMDIFDEEPLEYSRLEMNIVFEYKAKNVEKRETLTETFEMDRVFKSTAGGQILSVLARETNSRLVAHELNSAKGSIYDPTVSLKIYCKVDEAGETAIYRKFSVSSAFDFAKLERLIEQLKIRVVECLKELGSTPDEQTEPRNGK